ncbi:MAG TPA: class I SAM-dependent methyltransferase [Gaiellaceae bacterium]|nr:class I SAM-dependent methyltransferase [Gaiellaceae bacterium]
MPSATDPDAIVDREREIRDREARAYDRHRAQDTYHRTVEDACVFSQLDLRPEHTVVDAGCGTGTHLEALLDRAAGVIGADHSQASLDVARERVPTEKRERLTLVAADLRAMPLEDATADRVMCFEVIQHVPTDEHRRQALRELHRILKPGGVLVVSCYRWRGHIRRQKEGFFENGLYRYAFTASELGDLLQSARFADVLVGGAVILPALSQSLRVGVEAQLRLAFTPLGRHLSHYAVARGRRPA